MIVGDAPYADDYQERLQAAGDDRVVFAGYQFGAAYRRLLRNAALFVAPTEVGGTHPVIVEAMAAGACIVVNDHPPERGDPRRRRRELPRQGRRRRDCGGRSKPCSPTPRRSTAAGRRRRSGPAASTRGRAVTDAYEQVAVELAAGRSADELCRLFGQVGATA